MKELNIFFAYARENSDLRNRLDKHLATLKRNKHVKTWFDGKIESGREWENEIYNALETADIVLLLISADFISSDYCYEIEMENALERHKNGKSVVIPIILTHCDWADTPFSKLQALPKDAIPIVDRRWDTEDQAMKDVALGIKSIVSRIIKEREDNISTYYEEITSLKDEKEKLELELKYSHAKQKELEKLISKKSSEDRITEIEEKDKKISRLQKELDELQQYSTKQDKENRKLAINKRAVIINDGQLYTTINETDTITWPSKEIKLKAGEIEWRKSGFFPTANMVGEIINTMINPHTNKIMYLLLIDEKYYVPIGANGVDIIQ